MLALARKIGKQSAHDLVYQVAMTAYEDKRSLKSCIEENELIMSHLSIEEIESLFEQKNQLGLCPEFVDRTIELNQNSRENDKLYLERSYPR
jgi:adenylosuccinate lyase